MINYTRVSLVSVCLTLFVGSLVAATEISLTGRKDLVLRHETRVTVLDVAGRYLSDKGDSFLNKSAVINSPFSFEQLAKVVERVDDGEPVPVVEKVFNYDDASVLRVVAANFPKSVRGTLSRGTSSFLQLEGGRMIKPGTVLPVSIPLAKGQTFQVIVSAISSTSYTLQVGSEEQTIRLSGKSSSGSSSIKLD